MRAIQRPTCYLPQSPPGNASAAQSGPFQPHPTSDIRHPTSDIRHPTSDIRHPTSDIRHPTSDIRHPTSDIRHPTSDIRHPTSDIRHPTSDIRHPTSDIRHPTSDPQTKSTPPGLDRRYSSQTQWGRFRSRSSNRSISRRQIQQVLDYRVAGSGEAASSSASRLDRSLTLRSLAPRSSKLVPIKTIERAQRRSLPGRRILRFAFVLCAASLYCRSIESRTSAIMG